MEVQGALLLALAFGAIVYFLIKPAGNQPDVWHMRARTTAAWLGFLSFAGPFLLIRKQGFFIYLVIAFVFLCVFSGGAYGLVLLLGKIVGNRARIILPVTRAGKAAAERAMGAVTSSLHTTESIDDKYFSQVSEELDSNIKNLGLWTKAFVLADGDEVKQKVKYIELRVHELEGNENSVDEHEEDKVAPLVAAAQRGNTSKVIAELNRGINPHWKSKWNKTARQIAVEKGHTVIVRILEEAEKDWSKRSSL